MSKEEYQTIKSEKVLLIDEIALGKTKITKESAEALKTIGMDSKIIVFASDKKKLNNWLDEALSEIVEREVFVYEDVESENEKGEVYMSRIKKKEKREIKERTVNVEISPSNSKINVLLNYFRTSPFPIWIIDKNEEKSIEQIQKAIGGIGEFESMSGARGKTFLIDDYSDWKGIVEEDAKDFVKVKIVK